jgi:preprotein translocase subunit SecA
MLQIVDTQWKDHLYSLDHLKEGIGLRGYGQRDPLVEYKKESFALFQAMKDRIDEEIVRYLWRLRPSSATAAQPGAGPLPTPPPPRRPPQMTMNQPRRARRPSARSAAPPQPRRPPRRPAAHGRRRRPSRPVGATSRRSGRNDPCPCGSGKKYKKCHGA